jgi:hypothetical protein
MANDNPSPDAQKKVQRVVSTLARLIARQIAREKFEAQMAEAANDNQFDR